MDKARNAILDRYTKNIVEAFAHYRPITSRQVNNSITSPHRLFDRLSVAQIAQREV
jgi:hypothetical protein